MVLVLWRTGLGARLELLCLEINGIREYFQLEGTHKDRGAPAWATRTAH